jgi:hypothetical protein
VSGIQFIDRATRDASARWWQANSFAPHVHGYRFLPSINDLGICDGVHPVRDDEFPWTSADDPAAVFLVVAPSNRGGALVPLRGTDRPPTQTGPQPANLVNINGAHLADLVSASATFQQAHATHGRDLRIVLAVPSFATDASPNHARLFADRLGHQNGQVWASRHTVRLNRRGDFGVDVRPVRQRTAGRAWQHISSRR